VTSLGWDAEEGRVATAPTGPRAFAGQAGAAAPPGAPSAPTDRRSVPKPGAAPGAVPGVTSAPALVRAALRSLREAPRRLTLAAFWLSLCSLLTYAVVRHCDHVSMIDMVVYRAEGGAVVHGHDLYTLRVTAWGLPATYPPFAAMLFTPICWIPVPLLRPLVTLGNLALLGGFGYLSALLADWPRRALRPPLVLLVIGFGVWLEPVFTTLRYGQINLLIGVLVLYDLTRADTWRGKGVAVGLAAAIKITPGLVIVYLLLSGRIRAAVTAALTCAGTMLIGALTLPHASLEFWTKDLYDTSRVGKEYIVDNQSLRGMVDRALHETHSGTAALVLSGLVGLAGIAIAVGIHREGHGFPRGRAWSVLCCTITALLVSPISWTHHCVWCVPMTVLLIAEAAHERARSDRRRWQGVAVATVVAFLSFSMWVVPHKGYGNLHIPYLLQPFASIYPVLGLAFLALAGERLRRQRRRRLLAVARARSVPGQERGQGLVKVQ